MDSYRLPWMSDELAMFRNAVRKFVEAEVVPHEERWAKQQHVDRDAWRKAGDMGILLCDIPEQYGGAGATFAYECAVFEELQRANNTSFGKAVHSIVAHYLLAYGTEAQKMQWLPKMATGEMIAAIAMSEPGAGSDLQGIRTRAIRDGDHYVVSGSKTFITNGLLADLVCVVVKTDPAAGGKGISLLMVETAGLPGFAVAASSRRSGRRDRTPRSSSSMTPACRWPTFSAPRKGEGSPS